MFDVNTCTVSGEVVEDPSIGYTKTGNAIANIRIKSRRRSYGGATDGSYLYTYLTITVFGKNAQNCSAGVHKGQFIIATGALSVRQYEKRDGTKATSVEISTTEFVVLDDVGKPPVDVLAIENKSRKKAPIADDFDDESIPF